MHCACHTAACQVGSPLQHARRIYPAALNNRHVSESSTYAYELLEHASTAAVDAKQVIDGRTSGFQVVIELRGM
jgi:hypothetical protein